MPPGKSRRPRAGPAPREEAATPPRMDGFELLLDPPPVQAVPAGVGEGEPAGLSSKLSAGRFLAAVKPIVDGWDAATPDARSGPIVDAINAELAAAGVPLVNILMAPLSADQPGAFEGVRWLMKLSQSEFAQPTISPEAAERLAMTVYHEARHAEQHFGMARLRCERGEDIAAVADAVGIPEAIASLASKAPPLDPAVAARAATWDESRNGAGEAYQNEVYIARRTIVDALDAAEAVLGVVGPDDKKLSPPAKSAVSILQREFDSIQALYRALPLESDAWEVTIAVDRGFDGTVDQSE